MYQIVDSSHDWRQHQCVGIINSHSLHQTRGMSVIKGHSISDPRQEHHRGHPNLSPHSTDPRHEHHCGHLRERQSVGSPYPSLRWFNLPIRPLVLLAPFPVQTQRRRVKSRPWPRPHSPTMKVRIQTKGKTRKVPKSPQTHF